MFFYYLIGTVVSASVLSQDTIGIYPALFDSLLRIAFSAKGLLDIADIRQELTMSGCQQKYSYQPHAVKGRPFLTNSYEHFGIPKQGATGGCWEAVAMGTSILTLVGMKLSSVP